MIRFDRAHILCLTFNPWNSSIDHPTQKERNERVIYLLVVILIYEMGNKLYGMVSNNYDIPNKIASTRL
eukprot:gnl/Chilomastix_caulleri/751.p2 GENE.gnl/Chilomastix_caulleri/751~~gnl/Chilomastix_caulleri/751.p2  ORF type:complete len:69 (+),score=8.12 gnl/Chilomastix_caulleri/751:231-437(+)